jgi:hypothetical protein
MALNQINNYKIITPHAAIIVWNYDDRIGADITNASTVNNVNQTILSTVSCLSIQTSKSKGNPVGSFQVILAPTRDWVSTITAGSWCAILMSNSPITQSQIDHADPNFVKMIGKIESVRVETAVDDEGARHTTYLMSGSYWGHIFNNVLYIDNNIAGPNDPANQGNTVAILLQKALLGDGNTPQSFAIGDNLVTLMNIFGASADSITKQGEDIHRLAKAMYDFNIPTKMTQYFNFVDAENKVNNSTLLSNLLTLQMGRLIGDNDYEDTNEAYGFLDPFSLQGTNTFWQVLIENSNPALNEMYNEIEWENNGRGGIGPSLTIFNRIKPFSYRNLNAGTASSISKLRSMFKFIKHHPIDNVTVMSVSVGTNWGDKYNFIEIRPAFQDFDILKNWISQKNQISDPASFNREGFRPLIVSTKQFPVNPAAVGINPFNADYLTAWTALMKEWYFDTHKLLNGTLTMRGTTEYIAVGNNIMFEAGLISPTPNLNKGENKNKNTNYILAHVENISHNFTNIDGARTYTTVIQFVRGIVVDSSRNLVGSGSLDQIASQSLLESQYKNSVNTFGTSDGINDPLHPIDPDPNKLRGT